MRPLEESNVVKRVRRSLANLLAIAIAMFGIVAVAVPSHSQTPAPANKAAIVESIKKDAKRHIDNDIPIQTEVVIDLYKDNKAGLTAPKIAEIYEEEYSRLKKAKESNLWERLNPSGGWVVAFVLFVVLLFRDALAEWTSNVLKAIGSWIYKRFAGTRLFHKISLKRYRQALRDKYRQLHVPFRPDRPLQMREVYVPLKVAGTSDTKQIDAYEAVAQYRKLMVTGPPGSGKSMLLKHIALSYAEDRLLEAEKPIAIFLELHRLSDPQKSLKQHLVEALARDDFPNAELFVSQGLKRGKLMLLLDGLDEVNSSERPRVVLEIRDLLDYLDEHRCRVIITCRTAIYEGQFDDRVESRLEVVEFNDREIRQFLGAWASSMPENKSIEQLMQTLRDRPRIMALARNPLLLTIIAYLYSDKTFELPHSRAEFYQKATNILLDVWHRERNDYLARDKRSVLQHLALYFQENAERQQQDRRSVDHKQALAQVKEALPDLGLNPDDDAKPLLKEIVERSGLLLEIDGGDRYQFAHLTLQEFFAAAALRGNANELVGRFEKDPSAWRETAKLWCGLAEDSTTAIQSIYARDPVTAFECLADARKVQQVLAADIIENFKQRLSVADEDDRVVLAFAAVAADRRPRGQATFKFLKEKLIPDTDPTGLESAAKALSLTNLPGAAEVLASHYGEQPEIREHLVRMGDLAVPTLVELSAQGSEPAMDGLVAIGTTDAAKALVPLLWKADESLAARVAWRLATLLPQPNVEEALRNYSIANEQRRANWIDWIWQPFEEPADSALPVIAGRLAYLISQTQVELVSTAPLPKLVIAGRPAYLISQAQVGKAWLPTPDPRLIVPICSIQARGEIKVAVLERFKDRVSVFEDRVSAFEPDWQKRQLLGEILTASASPHWQNLLSSQTLNLQFDLLRRLISYRLPDTSDWRNVLRPVKYELKTGWHYRVILLLAAIPSLFALGTITFLVFHSRLILEQVLLCLETVIIVSFLSSIANTREIEDVDITMKAEQFMEIYYLGSLSFFKRGDRYQWDAIIKSAFFYASMDLIIMASLGCLLLVGHVIGLIVYLLFGITLIVPMWVAIAFGGIGFGFVLLLCLSWQLQETILFDRLTWIVLSLSFLFQCVSFAFLIKNGGLSAALLVPVLLCLSFLLFFLMSWENDLTGLRKILAIVIALPLSFCFPAVAYFATKAILLLFSWKTAVVFWATLLGSSTLLWVFGQKRDREARNPLHGILDFQTAGKTSAQNPSKGWFAFWPLRYYRQA